MQLTKTELNREIINTIIDSLNALNQMYNPNGDKFVFKELKSEYDVNFEILYGETELLSLYGNTFISMTDKGIINCQEDFINHLIKSLITGNRIKEIIFQNENI